MKTDLVTKLRSALSASAVSHLVDTGGASAIASLAAQVRVLPVVSCAGRLALRVSRAARRLDGVVSLVESLRQRRRPAARS